MERKNLFSAILKRTADKVSDDQRWLISEGGEVVATKVSHAGTVYCVFLIKDDIGLFDVYFFEGEDFKNDTLMYVMTEAPAMARQPRALYFKLSSAHLYSTEMLQRNDEFSTLFLEMIVAFERDNRKGKFRTAWRK